MFKPLGPLLEFPLLSSFDGLPCDAFLFTGCFLKFILVAFPSAPLYKLAPHNLAYVIAEDFVPDALWFLGCPYHGLPLWIRWQDHSGKWCTENGNAPPGRAPPGRASECVLRLRLCLPVGRGYMDTQGSTYYYLAKLAGPLTGGSPTRQREESRG